MIEASAVNGGVEINLGTALEVSDSIELETVNGGVQLGITADSKATIAARCVNGGVKVEDVEITKDGDSENTNDYERKRRLNGTMNGGGAKVNLNTTNGGIHLRKTSGKKTT